MSFADWSDEDYEEFYDRAFNDVFNHIDLYGLSDQEIGLAQELFEHGWLDFNIVRELADEYKEAFYDLTGYGPEDLTDPRMMDNDVPFWEAFRDAYDASDLG